VGFVAGHTYARELTAPSVLRAAMICSNLAFISYGFGAEI
jgi:hypothetical protein